MARNIMEIIGLFKLGKTVRVKSKEEAGEMVRLMERAYLELSKIGKSELEKEYHNKFEEEIQRLKTEYDLFTAEEKERTRVNEEMDRKFVVIKGDKNKQRILTNIFNHRGQHGVYDGPDCNCFLCNRELTGISKLIGNSLDAQTTGIFGDHFIAWAKAGLDPSEENLKEEEEKRAELQTALGGKPRGIFYGTDVKSVVMCDACWGVFVEYACTGDFMNAAMNRFNYNINDRRLANGGRGERNK